MVDRKDALNIDLRQYVRDIPDFPQPGVLFRDITPLLGDPVAYGHVLDLMSEPYRSGGIDAVVGIESRGFLFGAPLADRLGVPFVPIRKAGKLPAPVMTVEYALEYGTGQLDIHVDGLTQGQRAVVVDDVLATGGTAAAAARLVELVGGQVTELLFLAELRFLDGRSRLTDYAVRALIDYP